MTEFEARSRWSQAVLCPRQAAYGLRGTEPDGEPDEITQGYWQRGKQIEAWMGERFIAQYGRDDIVLQKPVPWPAGIAHGDIFVKSEKLAVEVKSKTDLRPLEAQILQLAGQVHFDPDAEQGALLMVDPSNLQTRTIPMPVVPDALVEEIERISDEVAASADPSAPLPERVCARPSEARQHMCPFAETCFADWEPPDVIELAGEVATLAERLVEIDGEMKEHAAEVADLERERDELRAKLKLTIEPGNEYSLDGWQTIRRTEVKGRVTYDIPTALSMGVVSIDTLKPFRTEGRPWDRWTIKPVKQTEDSTVAPLPEIDYGEVPF